MFVGPTKRWFAWYPVKIDGQRYWLRWVYRRRISESYAMGYAAWVRVSDWQYSLEDSK